MRRKCVNVYTYGDPTEPGTARHVPEGHDRALSGKAGEKAHTEWKVNGASPKAQKALADAFRVGTPAYHGSANEGEAIGRPCISTIGALQTLERAMMSVLWMGPKAAAIARGTRLEGLS